VRRRAATSSERESRKRHRRIVAPLARLSHPPRLEDHPLVEAVGLYSGSAEQDLAGPEQRNACGQARGPRVSRRRPRSVPGSVRRVRFRRRNVRRDGSVRKELRDSRACRATALRKRPRHEERRGVHSACLPSVGLPRRTARRLACSKRCARTVLPTLGTRRPPFGKGGGT
jgi:hypothetical protein